MHDVVPGVELCDGDLQGPIERSGGEDVLLLLLAFNREVSEAIPVLEGDFGYEVIEPVARGDRALVGDCELELALSGRGAQECAEIGQDTRLTVAVVFGLSGGRRAGWWSGCGCACGERAQRCCHEHTPQSVSFFE